MGANEVDGPPFDEEEIIGDIVSKLGIVEAFRDGLVGVERLFPFLSTSEVTSTTSLSFVRGFRGEGGVIGV